MARKDTRTAQQPKVDQTQVLRLFKQQGKPLTAKDVLRGLKATNAYRGQVADILDDLLRAGRIIKLQGAYGLAESMNLVTGVLEIQRSGVGYVICDDKRPKDIFINPRDFGDAWHGDRVAVALTRTRGATQEGRIARVVERTAKVLPCRVERRLRQDLYICRPSDPRHLHAFVVETPQALSQGDVVTVEADERLDAELFTGNLVERLGDETDVAVQERLVKLSNNIPGPFPKAALDQAQTLPGVPGEEDFAGRVDLRDTLLVTIDGETARDFDDAVYVEKNPEGFRLVVAIADVGHYVPQGSPLDQEAQERGNSYYFPTSVAPMFPEALSNGLCSLNPGVPRLAMVADIRMSLRGLPLSSTFYPAVIQSKARLTYDQVNRAVILGQEEDRQGIAHVVPMLEDALELARLMSKRRAERGSLDFDLPEPQVRFGPGGQAVDITPRERHFAHRLIEEFMIAANEAVATHLTAKGRPLPYRVHPEPNPDKLEALFELVRLTELTQQVPPAATVKGLQSLLARVAGTSMEFLVNRMTLRSMMQASYNVHNEGHFGLASACYCHFTSPIRRYADLMVHRALKDDLAGREAGLPAKPMQAVCETISRTERVAMEAEREILKRLTVLFLQDKVGQTFTGVINSLSDFGFWVELVEVMAEGMVRLSTLTDDYYALFPERQELIGHATGKRFTLGQKVRVELTDVNLSRLEVNLRLTEGGDDRPRARPRGKARPGPAKGGKGKGRSPAGPATPGTPAPKKRGRRASGGDGGAKPAGQPRRRGGKKS